MRKSLASNYIEIIQINSGSCSSFISDFSKDWKTFLPHFPAAKDTWLPWWLSGKESPWQCRRHRFDPWDGKFPWRRKWQPTPVFLPGKSCGHWWATVQRVTKNRTQLSNNNGWRGVMWPVSTDLGARLPGPNPSSTLSSSVPWFPHQ